MTASRLPAVYVTARFRNVTPVDEFTQEIGIGFDLADGTVLRLALPVTAAQKLAECLADYLNLSHSGRSGEMASDPKLMPEGGEKVEPDAASSAAATGES